MWRVVVGGENDFFCVVGVGIWWTGLASDL
jgi:hypothetical protein